MLFKKKKVNKYKNLYKCNLHKDPEDCRDYTFKSVGNTTDLPEEVDFRAYMPEIWNQGNIGSCQSFAFNRIYSFYNDNQFKPSSLFLYYNVRDLEGTINEDSGGTLRDTIKAANNLGVCTEETYPYVVEKFKEKPPTKAYLEAYDNNGGMKFKYYRVNNSMELYEAMCRGYVPYLGIFITDSFYSDKCMKTGVVPNPSTKQYGGHAVTPTMGHLNKNTNYILNRFQSKGYFIFDNSWGTDVGDNGRFKISFETLDKMLLDCWAVDIDYIEK